MKIKKFKNKSYDKLKKLYKIITFLTAKIKFTIFFIK